MSKNLEKKTLETTNENVNEVMYNVGYTDPKAFRNRLKSNNNGAYHKWQTSAKQYILSPGYFMPKSLLLF